MRTMIPSMLIVGVLFGPAPAMAQLPPEILADSYLLRAEQALREGEPTRARAESDKILLLQKEHELDLSEEFHFRYAKAAAAADLPEQALEAVVKYLTAAGRESPHYVEALELMNQAKDAIAGRTEPRVALTGPRPSESAAIPVPIEVQSGKEFFLTATIQSVKARNEDSDCNTDTACSADGVKEMEDVKALSCVLAIVATRLEKLEKDVAKQNQLNGIHAEIDRRKPFELTKEDLCTVQKELKCLALGQRREGGRVIANLDIFLIRSHVKYKELKKYKEKWNLNENTQYSRDIDDIEKNIHALLTRRGLHRTMSAVVRGGTTLADVASDQEIRSGKPSAILPKSVNVLLGTKHWNDEEGPYDFSLTGQIGIVPILAIYESANDPNMTDHKMLDAKTPKPTMPSDAFALHQSGLIYEAYFNFNFFRPGSSEMSFFIGGGQTRLWDRDANIGPAQQPTTVQLVENGPGLSAYRYGGGVEYKLYAQELDIVHHDKSLLSPVFNVGGGLRWDERLRAWPGLNRPERGPPRRCFVRLGFDLRQVFGQRRVEDKGKINVFGIRLVADREWGGNFPTANRLLIEADFNLSKLLMGNATGD